MAAKKPTVSLEDALTAIAKHAPALRAAGVLQVSIDGQLGAVLAPAEPLPSSVPPPRPRPVHTDPLQDPDTFPGGRVPGYKRED